MADWKEALPEAERTDPTIKDIPDIATLVKNYKETKAFVGTSIRPPGPDASPAARKEFLEKMQKHAPELASFGEDAESQAALWKRLGVPEKPEGYEFKPPEGVDLPLEGLRATAMAAGMTKKQFEKMAAKAIEGIQSQSAAAIADRTALKTEWGQAYEEKLKAAAQIASKHGVPDALVAQIVSGKMHSSQLKLWDSIAASMGRGEGSEVSRQGSGGAQKLTPGEARAQMAEIQTNPAYRNKNDPKQAALVAKYQDLVQFAYPEQA